MNTLDLENGRGGKIGGRLGLGVQGGGGESLEMEESHPSLFGADHETSDYFGKTRLAFSY